MLQGFWNVFFKVKYYLHLQEPVSPGNWLYWSSKMTHCEPLTPDAVSYPRRTESLRLNIVLIFSLIKEFVLWVNLEKLEFWQSYLMSGIDSQLKIVQLNCTSCKQRQWYWWLFYRLVCLFAVLSNNMTTIWNKMFCRMNVLREAELIFIWRILFSLYLRAYLPSAQYNFIN